MRKFLALAASITVLAACEPPRTVKALRYSIVYAESSLGLAHGEGQWVQEIFFPDLKVACMLVYEYRELMGGKGTEPRLYAFEADRLRNDLTGLHGAKPSAIEEIEVPVALAEEIRKLAELNTQRERETWRLGQEVAGKLMKKLPQEGDGPR